MESSRWQQWQEPFDRQSNGEYSLPFRFQKVNQQI
jgi:hypothetical protein